MSQSEWGRSNEEGEIKNEYFQSLASKLGDWDWLIHTNIYKTDINNKNLLYRTLLNIL